MTLTVEKVVMATNNSGLNSAYLLISGHEERRERERRERPRARTIRRRAREEDRPREVSMLHLVAEADRVLYHLIMF